MSSQSDAVVGDATKAAPEQGAAEQKQTSFEDQLLQLAREDGLVGNVPKAEDQSAVEEPPVQDEPPAEDEVDIPSTPAEGEDVEEEKEEPAAKGEPWPESAKARVAEEAEKRRRANERADRTEAELAKTRTELEEARRNLLQSSGPAPTPDSPLVDIQDPIVLDRLERVYEALEEVDIERVNEDGTVTVPSAIGADGKLVYQNIDPDQARLAQKRADRVLRKDIPQRRQYLAQRAQIDAGATEWYPDLKNQEHEFTRLVNQLTGQVLNGTAMSNPEVKFWAANAVYGFMKRREEAQTSNGKGSSASVKTVVDASRQKLAPTAPRTRATVERKSSADLAKAQEKFERNPDDRDAAADYVASVLSGKNRQKTVQPTAE